MKSGNLVKITLSHLFHWNFAFSSKQTVHVFTIIFLVSTLKHPHEIWVITERKVSDSNDTKHECQSVTEIKDLATYFPNAPYNIHAESPIKLVAKVIKCLAGDQRVVGWSLTWGTVLCPWARHFTLCFILRFNQGRRPNMTEKCWMGYKEPTCLTNLIKHEHSCGVRSWYICNSRTLGALM